MSPICTVLTPDDTRIDFTFSGTSEKTGTSMG